MASCSDTFLSSYALTQYSKGSDFGAELVMGCVHPLPYETKVVKWRKNCIISQKHFSKKNSFGEKNVAITHLKFIYLENARIQTTNNTKFLGLIFDEKLRWTPRTDHFCKVCLRKLNLIETLSHSIFRADRSTLLHIYRALIRSKCTATIYASASHAVLNKLILFITQHFA